MYNIHIGPHRFFGFHGIHEEEKILGNVFEVSLKASADQPNEFGSLNDTVDYTVLFDIVQKHMNIPTPLLETIAQNIYTEIFSIDPRIKEIQLSIYKLHPPIQGCHGKVGINITQSA